MCLGKLGEGDTAGKGAGGGGVGGGSNVSGLVGNGAMTGVSPPHIATYNEQTMGNDDQKVHCKPEPEDFGPNYSTFRQKSVAAEGRELAAKKGLACIF